MQLTLEFIRIEDAVDTRHFCGTNVSVAQTSLAVS